MYEHDATHSNNMIPYMEFYKHVNTTSMSVSHPDSEVETHTTLVMETCWTRWQARSVLWMDPTLISSSLHRAPYKLMVNESDTGWDG